MLSSRTEKVADPVPTVVPAGIVTVYGSGVTVKSTPFVARPGLKSRVNVVSRENVEPPNNVAVTVDKLVAAGEASDRWTMSFTANVIVGCVSSSRTVMTLGTIAAPPLLPPTAMVSSPSYSVSSTSENTSVAVF